MFLSAMEKKRVNTLLGKDKDMPKAIKLDNLEWSYYQRGWWAWFNRTLFYSGLDRTARGFFLLRICLWVFLPLLIAALISSLIPLLVSALLTFFEITQIKQGAAKRIKGFVQDYSALLLSLASSVKSGADPIFAMSQTVNLFPPDSVIWPEVSSFRDDIETGLGEELSLRRFALSINYPDLDLFRVAMILARKEGSSLGECLQRLAKVTRQRQSFSRKVKSAVATQKMAAMGIAACAVAIGIIQYLSSPEVIANAWAHPLGSKILMAGVFILIFGIVWMRKIAMRTM